MRPYRSARAKWRQLAHEALDQQVSAELYLRAFDPAIVSEDIVREYVILINAPMPEGPEAWRQYEAAREREKEIREVLYHYESGLGRYALLGDGLWIGNVSWAKAGTSTWRKWVPRSVEHFTTAYERRGGIVPLTAGFCAHLMTGFNLKHDSAYETPRDARGGTTKRGIYGRGRSAYSKGVIPASHAKRFFQKYEDMLSFLEIQ